MAYKHGTYGEQKPFGGNLPLRAIGTVPAYIGTAPVHMLNGNGEKGFNYSPLINQPILIESYPDAQKKLGYSSDWAKFTLGEAVSAHFLAGDHPVGPIVCVNMMDPSKLAAADTTTTVTLTGASGDKVGYIQDSLAAIENITISGSLTVSDYTLSYEDGKIKVHITKSGFSAASVTATYKQIHVSDTTLTPALFEAALNGLDIAESATGVIPNILAAPGYSHKTAYHAKLIAKAVEKIAQKHHVIACSDIPSGASTNTVGMAQAWKTENGYDNRLDKVFWPMVKSGADHYHLTTIAAVDMQKVDTDAGGVPYISPSNKVIPADAAVLEDGTEIYLSEVAANELNAAGITTVNVVRSALRLWGPHMANYSYANEDKILPENRQDASIRMGVYMMNYLQRNYIDRVDTPVSRRDVDSILASVQQWINGLVNAGQLLYGKISFEPSSNSTTDLINGDFVFDIQDTTTPNAKSLTFRAQYTTEGLATLIGGETV